MTPEQNERLFSTLGRIEQKIDSHLSDDEAVHDRQDAAISDVTSQSNKNATSIARMRGAGIGAGGILTLVISALGLDRFGG